MSNLLLDFNLAITEFGAGARTYFETHHGYLQAVVLWIFATLNSVRIVAYLPQILRAARDTNGASAISYTTWGLFLASHVTTIAYALVCLGDGLMALIFFGNALACLAILVTTAVKRNYYRKRLA